MGFRMLLVNHTPPTSSSDPDAVAAALMRDIGLLHGGLEVVPSAARRRRGRPRRGGAVATGSSDPPRPGEEVLSSVPYRMFMDCFLRDPRQGHTVEELETRLGASRPTVYRHLQRLRELDLVTVQESEGADGHRRSYCVRFGSASKAWRFIETNAQCALDGLREQVDAVWADAMPRRKKERGTGELVLDLTSSRVSFRLPLVERSPPDIDIGPEARLVELLERLGYLTSWSMGPQGEDAGSSLPYKLFKECLLDRPDRSWTIREMVAVLHTSKPTLYRHLKKLEAMDLLERGLRGESPRSSKAFRIRQGDLGKAWTFTEEHARLALRSYRETVAYLEGLL